MTITINQTGRPAIDGLTPAQHRTLLAIQNHIKSQKVPPTMQELASALGINAASAHEHVNALVRKGYLKREPRKARCLTIQRKAVIVLA